MGRHVAKKNFKAHAVKKKEFKSQKPKKPKKVKLKTANKTSTAVDVLLHDIDSDLHDIDSDWHDIDSDY